MFITRIDNGLGGLLGGGVSYQMLNMRSDAKLRRGKEGSFDAAADGAKAAKIVLFGYHVAAIIKKARFFNGLT